MRPFFRRRVRFGGSAQDFKVLKMRIKRIVFSRCLVALMPISLEFN